MEYVSKIRKKVSEWRSSRSDQTVLGLKVSSVESGKRAAREKIFFPGDGILEVNQVSLATGSLSFRYETFRKALREPLCVVRIVTQDLISEIESLESRYLINFQSRISFTLRLNY